MQSKIHSTACKLDLDKAVKSKNIKLPEKPESFSGKNTVKHSSTLGVKRFDVCNKSQMIQEKNSTRMNIQSGKE